MAAGSVDRSEDAEAGRRFEGTVQYERQQFISGTAETETD